MDTESNTLRINDQRLWSIAECANVFTESINSLKKAFQEVNIHGFILKIGVSYVYEAPRECLHILLSIPATSYATMPPFFTY